MIDIKNLKKNFVSRFPSNPVSRILLVTPDDMNAESFRNLAVALLAIVEDEKPGVT